MLRRDGPDPDQSSKAMSNIFLEDWALLALKDPWNQPPSVVSRAVKAAIGFNNERLGAEPVSCSIPTSAESAGEDGKSTSATVIPVARAACCVHPDAMSRCRSAATGGRVPIAQAVTKQLSVRQRPVTAAPAGAFNKFYTHGPSPSHQLTRHVLQHH